MKIQWFKTSILIGLVASGMQALAQQPQLQSFSLNEVHLLKSPFLDAEQTDMGYMLKLDPDRLLAPFLREAGLKPKAESYGNWENTGLDGHTAGHYLTALAQMYASTGQKVWKTRLDYMVSELKRCQDNRTDGYVGGVPEGPLMWEHVANGNFDLFNKRWVPWYNLHKLYAGLRDAYLIGGNAEAKDVLIKLTDWADRLLSKLSEQQIQKMLDTEQGGMNEVCADVAAITGDNKYLVLAKKFDHQAILQPLEAHQDKLNGLHANTQIPKVIGFERIAELDNDSSFDSAARFFWETVVDNRSISIGGNSVREHFNPANNFISMVESEQGPETCNSYNMLKLTKMLFLTKPDAKYMNYYERTLYNHILSSQHPGKGGFVYFTPIRPDHYRVYSQPDEGFWCCVGTGMENHGKYGEMIYAHQGKDLYVNLFIASKLDWKQQGIALVQTNNFPFEEKSELRIVSTKPSTFKLWIRQPEWVKEGGFTLRLNGKFIKAAKDANGYVSINRKWNNGDRVSIQLPMRNKLEYLPDHSEWVSIVHGPIVLAAATDTTKLVGLMADGSRFGHVATGPLEPIDKAPLLVDNGNDISAELKPITEAPLRFTFANMVYQPQYKQLKLMPFFELHDARYMLYWPIAKADSIEQRKHQLADDDNIIALAKRTVDQVSPGEQQPESDHSIESNGSKTGVFRNKHWRDASGYFAYKMRTTPSVKALLVTYYGGDANRSFDIYLDDQKLAHVVLDGSQGDIFFTKEYAIPASVAKPGIVVVKFVAEKGSIAGGVFDVRMVKESKTLN
ncbi:glycoside hydrolase family 127 protein [Mucilaginibacter agri]|uniref:Glycosyl hydrolase n=1 Tax=Mucilaginibacter agri TaxID=2695265 RepID=A0A965ZE76_9SPHI|nr:glycoside hydrolase family 127 protein [Mucilaginibacter agri]NCD68147.1 glycosyl hydrolase [Mucilaginibacter agri]